MVFVGLLGMVLMMGCDGGNDDSASIGNVSVQGNIASFDAGTANVNVTAAGVTAGVTVRVKGTSHSATTAEDGTFVISGVEAGNHTLVISYGGVEIEYPLGDCPVNSRIEIFNVSVLGNGSIVVERVDVIHLGSNEKSTIVKDDDNGDPVEESSAPMVLTPAAMDRGNVGPYTAVVQGGTLPYSSTVTVVVDSGAGDVTAVIDVNTGEITFTLGEGVDAGIIYTVTDAKGSQIQGTAIFAPLSLTVSTSWADLGDVIECSINGGTKPYTARSVRAYDEAEPSSGTLVWINQDEGTFTVQMTGWECIDIWATDEDTSVKKHVHGGI